MTKWILTICLIRNGVNILKLVMNYIDFVAIQPSKIKRMKASTEATNASLFCIIK